MQAASFVHLLLLLFINLRSKIIYAFAEGELGLNLAPPTVDDTDTAKELNKYDKIPGDKVAKLAAIALQPFAPPELVYGAITKLMEKVDRKVDIIDSTEYTTALGFPCNPNESKLCFKRTSTTTTTTEEPSLFKQRREGRPVPYHPPEPSDYDKPPPQITDFNQVITQAREAFDRQTTIAQELEAERRKRAFLSYMSGDRNEQEQKDFGTPKFTESVRSSKPDYKKSKLTSEAIQNVVGREAVSLRGWFPDIWTPNRQGERTATTETSRRRRLEAGTAKQLGQAKKRRCLEEKKVAHDEELAEKHRMEGKQNDGDSNNTSEVSDGSSDPKQISGSVNSTNSNSDASVPEKPESNSLSKTSWMERFWPTFILEKLVLPEIITSWFSEDEDEEFCECWDDDEDEDEIDMIEEDFDEFDLDDDPDSILSVQFMSMDAMDDNYDSSKKRETGPTPIITISLSFPASFESFPFSIDKPELREDEERSPELPMKNHLNSSQTDRPSSMEQQQERMESKMHYVRGLRTTPSIVQNEKERNDIELAESEAALTAQNALKPTSHLFRDFRQIPDIFDFVNSIMPPFLQLEGSPIGHLFSTKDSANQKKVEMLE